METFDKLQILARRRKKTKGKSKSTGSGRSGMLRVVMRFLSGDRGDSLAQAVNSGDPDKAKNIWTGIADDLYQAVEMIRDKKVGQKKAEIKAFREPIKTGGRELPSAQVKSYIGYLFKPFLDDIDLEYVDTNPVKRKEEYEEAVYVRLRVVITNPKVEERVVKLITKILKLDNMVAANLKIKGIPETSGLDADSIYNVDFIYYTKNSGGV